MNNRTIVCQLWTGTTPPEAGDLGRALAREREGRAMGKCPFCGNEITRCTISSDAGKVSFSLCCDVDLDLLDNYEVYAALPEPLQQRALEQSRAEYAAYRERARKSAAFFRQSRAAIDARYGHLMKRGTGKCQSETEPPDDSFG